MDANSPLTKIRSQSVHSRKLRNTSFASSEGEKEEKQKLKEYGTEEVSWGLSYIVNMVYAGQTVISTLIVQRGQEAFGLLICCQFIMICENTCQMSVLKAYGGVWRGTKGLWLHTELVLK